MLMEKYGIGFKEMDKKQKVRHIWTYYRYHILSVILAVLVIGGWISSFIFPEEASAADVIVCGQMHVSSVEQEEKEAFDENYNIGVNLRPLNWEKDIESANAMLQNIPFKVSIDELDIVALPTSIYERFVMTYGEDMFMPLENVEELKGILAQNQDKLYSCNKKYDDDGNEIEAVEHIYGIRTSHFPGLESIEECEEMVIGITINLRDKNAAIAMYKYILGDEAALDDFLIKVEED